MNLKFLSKDDLMNRFSKLTQTERKITHLILECLNEIELRRLHLEMGYSSLYYLLTEKYDYTPASAQRRTDGARLLRQVPTLADKIESGDLNLTKVSLIQKSIKQAEKESNTKYTREQKQILVEKVALAQGTIEQTQVLLAQELNLAIPTPHEKTQHHRDASVTLTMHLTAQEMEQIKQVRDLLSNGTESLELKDLFIYLAQRELKKYDKKNNDSQNISLNEVGGTSLSQKMNSKKDLAHNINANTGINNNQSPQRISAKEVKVQSRNFNTKTKRSLIKPGACCEYINPVTQIKCGSKSFLNIDHIQPMWAGGNNEPENLRVLCKNHNVNRYRIQSNIQQSF